jgi:hypothetical protein
MQVGEYVVKEWQRLPRKILSEWCQSQKRPTPFYCKAPHATAAPGPGQGKHRARVVLPDPKRKQEKDLHFCPKEGWASPKEAEHMAALLALRELTPSMQYDRKLPDPFRQRWLDVATCVTPASAHRSHAEKKEAVLKKEVSQKQNKNQREVRCVLCSAVCCVVLRSINYSRQATQCQTACLLGARATSLCLLVSRMAASLHPSATPHHEEPPRLQ